MLTENAARPGSHKAATGYHVVFMGNFLYPQGMAPTKRIQHAIDYLMSRGDTAVLILPLRQAHPGRDENRLFGTHKGVPYHTLGADLKPDWRLPFYFLSFLLDGCYQLFAARQRRARNFLYLYNEPDLESVFFVLFARVLGYSVICDIVEDGSLLDPGAGILSRLKAYTASLLTRNIRRLADAIVVISSSLQLKFSKLTEGSIPIERIPATIDPAVFKPQNQFLHNPIRLLYAGSFGEKDGVDNLISAFEKVRQDGIPAVLWLTGRGTAQRMKCIEARISSSHFRQEIIYLGYLNDDEYFESLANSDILCMVRTGSRYANAGFPFKLGEYLATGKPVIASRVGDVPQYLEDKQDALLVTPGSGEAIAAAIAYIANHPETSLKIGLAGKAVAAREFDYRTAWEKLMPLLDQV